ncbi:MAG TPA: S8 family peptidase [Thiobacillus sp.]|nr:S8 family peptidase [Thiobacillus sp.]
MMLKRLLPILALFLVSGVHADSSPAEEGRVIVKYRQTPDAPRQALSLDRTSSLSARLGLVLRSGRHINALAHVIRAAGVSSEALASRLSQEADVEYAIPDRLRTAHSLPNDPLFSGQWYLQATEAASIHATESWDQTTGSSNIVVAVVDTGVRFDHPDLYAKLLPGYDFISDAPNAGDGDGRDMDASDPGDFILASDTEDPDLQAVCGSELVPYNSSWHGTRVAGIVGAAGNNSVGIAGTSWGAKILPVRVLGKCGGFDSDIIAGMRWAAGLSVPGVPNNPNPARIINLSLGGSGGCTFAYADVIAELAGKDTLVVAVAGNESGPVSAPGNCAGILTVAGVRHVGTKVGYSSFGPEVSVSAPAGNCVNSYGPCLYSIDTATNLGATSPAANGYTDAYNYNAGTSFSAPQAAGVAALMLSVNPALPPADVIARIKQSARAFPTDNTLSTCPDVTVPGDTVDQCNCTTTTCGAGILDAAAAVAAALPAAQPSAMTLRDAIYLYNQPLDGSGDKILAGVDCDVFQLVLDVTSGYTDLAMGQSNTLTNAIGTQTAYPDTIQNADAMFAYALYQDQPVKTFVFNDKNNPSSSAQIGSATIFGYCYSTKPTAHIYFQQKDSCTNTYSDKHTTSCTVNDNGSGDGTGNTVSLALRDAIYLYGQPLNGKGDKILAGENCDVFQLILDVNSGYTDLAMSQSSTLDNAISTQTPYPDRIFSTADMFSYALYENQAVKTFVFNDKNAPDSSSQTGTATVFGYCYSTNPNARAYIREKDKCTDKYSNGQTSAIEGCLQ